MSDKVVSLYVTFENIHAATQVATQIVNEGFAACANIMPGVQSVFRYEGALKLENEVVVFFKTSADGAQDAIDRLKALHSYETPCIVALPVVGGDEGYFEWVRSATAAPSAKPFGHDH